MKKGLIVFSTLIALASGAATADAVKQTKAKFDDKFRQLDEVLPTANVYRNAAGEPGHEYWQQKVDYDIKVALDENNRRITASETVTYQNNSPDTLKYLWLQLDQNKFKRDSMAEKTTAFAGIGRRGPATRAASGNAPAKLSFSELRRQQFMDDHELGYEISNVVDGRGRALNFVIVGTNMRIDLASPLAPGDSTEFSLDFAFNMVDENTVSARGGYEHFPDDEREGGNDIFLLAQWFPRLHAYTDYEAWTNKEFLGRGEFTLEFGNYEVEMTVPADHIVSSTGVLQNANQVLTREQRNRLDEARNAERPVFIVTAEEALENEREGTDEVKTWRFAAENVRDFAWASSRKFMWDAKGYNQGGDVQPFVMAMSFYPKEGGDLWKKYSTEAVVHTMEVYGRFSFDYPYPVSQSVNGPVGGMEYPMITFNGPRTTLNDDGSRTYSQAEKRYLIGVVIHEVGHNYFPMIVNSDERQWTWMDEGLNSYLDGVAGREWDPTIPWGVEPRDITGYMKSQRQVPIMTQSDSIWRIGPNAYTKPAAALNILRETILGRELFDFAFKEYANRWRFKRPTPSDFFRTMEEASGVDLDWFWRGWFYSTDHVDISLDHVYKLRLDTEDPDIDYARLRQVEEDKPVSLFVERNKAEGKKLWVELNPDVTDFYDENDRFTVTNKERNKYNSFMDGLKDWERDVLTRAVAEDKNYYILDFSNKGGLVMPIILQMTFTDGTTEDLHIPAEIWRRTPDAVKKLIVTDKELTQVVVDPYWETADTDVENNHYPRRIIPSRVEAFKDPSGSGLVRRDIMQDSKTKLKTGDAKDGEDGR
ncbi:MAG: M1 family metallopeptidase [Kordiimonadaceae bacterium]|nr:M1 family metallopeptidase [Kordiimonadaceae bacterium]MBO6569765.1 M1 family metallopeptidase [Kordiimonadaceae bacterium]MBO6966300.1 M1 family metallopeptidase [Kordiimonadaceae bacterium]